MKKENVELMILSVTSNGEDAIRMKIYKNGTTCRTGVGALPELGVSGMSFFNDSRFFDPLLELVPYQALEQPIMHEEPTPNGYLEYVVAFFGDSKNDSTGEDADWAQSTGIRIKMDLRTGSPHPIMGLLDGLIMEAAELTNNWYFDVMMLACYNAKSNKLPEQTIITTPKSQKDTAKLIDNYVNQMNASARHWNINEYTHHKTFEFEGKTCRCVIMSSALSMEIRFLPVSLTEGFSHLQVATSSSHKNETTQQGPSKPWWKLW